MYTVSNNQNLDFTGSSKTNPYGLVQHPYNSNQKGGKKKNNKSRKLRKSRRNRKSKKSRKHM